MACSIGRPGTSSISTRTRTPRTRPGISTPCAFSPRARSISWQSPWLRMGGPGLSSRSICGPSANAHVARDRLQQYVREFHIDERRGDPRLVRFVNLMFTAFRPEIEALQEEKARAIAVHRLTHPDVDPFEDRSLEVLSRIAIDLRDDALSRRHTCNRPGLRSCHRSSPSRP